MDKLLLASPNCQDLSLNGTPFEIKKFPDSESYIRIPVEVKGKEVTIVHRCYPDIDSSLMQLILAIRQVREMKAKSIRAVIPYLPYARQDKRFLSGEAMSSEIVCSMLKEAGCERLFTFDCHFLKKQGEFVYGGLPITNKSLGSLVVEHLKKGLSKPIVISPDEGARYLTQGEKDKGVMKKVRGEYKKGSSAYREIATLEAKFDVSGRDVIIVDDIIAGGSTMVKALLLCKSLGAKKVRCGAAHGLLLGESLKKLSASGADEVACSNSILTPASKVDISGEISSIV
jgi:ribose-phosphate pyrophosphokinase